MQIAPKAKPGKIYWNKVLEEFFITIILPPFIGLPRLISNAMEIKRDNKTKYLTYIICNSAIVATIISTKPPTGDQISYSMAYAAVPQQGFIGSLINIYGYLQAYEAPKTTISVEFMNGVYNYVGYYLTFGYYPLFLFFYFTFEFSLIGMGLYHYLRNLKRPTVPIVSGMMILLFFYLFFIMCSQLQKQYLGQAIMMYVLGCYADYGKMNTKLWIITAISIFTHQSMLLFVPFLLFKPFKQRLTKKSLIMLIGFVFVFIAIAPNIAGKVTNNTNYQESSALTYGLNRLSNAKQTDGLTMDIVQFIVVCIPMLYILFKNLWIERKKISNHVAYMLNIALLLIVLIIAMQPVPLLQYRYFNTTFSFLPFIYPFMFSKIKSRDYFLKFVGFSMLFILMATIGSTGRTYAPLINLICEPPILLIAGFF